MKGLVQEMNIWKIRFKYWTSILSAIQGKFVWHNLIKNNPEIQNTVIVLMPSRDEEVNKYALKYLDNLIERTRRKDAVILTIDTKIEKNIKNYSEKIIRVISFPRKQALKLIKYVALYEFDNRLYIASLEEPYGRFGNRLEGINDITKEEIVATGIYRITI